MVESFGFIFSSMAEKIYYFKDCFEGLGKYQRQQFGRIRLKIKH